MKFDFIVVEYVIEENKIVDSIKHNGFTSFHQASEFIKKNKAPRRAFEIINKKEK